MDESRRAIVKLLSEFADELLSLPEADYRDLLDGKVGLTLSRKPKFKQKKRAKSADCPDEAALTQIAADLHQLSDREEGIALLLQRCKTKTCLEMLSRFLDLPVRREDTVETFQNRIIEATIGFRLRSQAIRGKIAGNV